MTREETIQVLSILKAAYPKFYANLTRESAMQIIELWSVMFADDEVDHVKTALYKQIATRAFPPAIADIRKAMLFVTETNENDLGEAWGEVMKAVRNFGYIRETEALESLNSITRKAVESMGWQNICMSENLMADRAHFFKIYETMEKRDKENMLLPAQLKEQMARLQKGTDMALIGRKEI